MKRFHLIAALLVCMLMPATGVAAEASSRSSQIANLEQQYLSSNNGQHRHQALKALAALAPELSSEDAASFHSAISAMLPAANSAEEADALLNLNAAVPDQPPAQAVSAQDEALLVDARQAARQASSPAGDVETLADIRIDQLAKDSRGHDGLASSLVQQVWRINTSRGARSFSNRSIMYSGMNETLSMVRARVLRGKHEIDAAVSPGQPVVLRGSAMFFDSLSRSLRFCALRPGDLIELEYRLLPASTVNPWKGYYARMDQMRTSLPVRLWRRVLVAPSSVNIYAVEHDLPAASVHTSGAETTRIWEVRSGDDAALRMADNSGKHPYLHVSTIGTMQEFGRWYNALLEPDLKLDSNLRALAEQIRSRNLSVEARAAAVYEAVQQRTRYTAFEFGVHSYQPYPVSLVERRGFGDCKDKAAMLVALLRAVDVPAEFAMVRTRSAGAAPEDAYSVQLFDHALAYIPQLHIFVDGTAEGMPLGELPAKDQGAMAVTVDAQGNATRRIVPSTQPGYGRTPATYTAELEHPAEQGETAIARQTAATTTGATH